MRGIVSWTGAGTSCTVSNLSPDTGYSFIVRARNSAGHGWSDDSPILSIRTLPEIVKVRARVEVYADELFDPLRYSGIGYRDGLISICRNAAHIFDVLFDIELQINFPNNRALSNLRGFRGRCDSCPQRFGLTNFYITDKLFDHILTHSGQDRNSLHTLFFHELAHGPMTCGVVAGAADERDYHNLSVVTSGYDRILDNGEAWRPDWPWSRWVSTRIVQHEWTHSYIGENEGEKCTWQPCIMKRHNIDAVGVNLIVWCDNCRNGIMDKRGEYGR